MLAALLAVPEALQERLTHEGTVEAIEEAANAAAKAYTDHGLSGDPFHAIVMPLRRALSYLARPAVPEALEQRAVSATDKDATPHRRLGPSWRESMAYEQGFEDGQKAARAHTT